MKKTFFKYKRHQILFWLSLILLLCAFIIIRDCTLPLISFNTVIDKYVKNFFLSSSTDPTFYNIAISYVAAYIFYIIQVYIPATLNNNHGITLLRSNIEKSINNIRILLLIIPKLTVKKQDGLYLANNAAAFFIIEKKQKQIFKITFLETYATLKTIISNKNNYVLNSPLLNYLDDNLSKLLCTLPLEDLFILSDNIYNQMQKNIKTKIDDNNSLLKTESIISELEQRYGFSFETYDITDDLNSITRYMMYSVSMTEYTKNELQIKVKLDDSDSSH